MLTDTIAQASGVDVVGPESTRDTLQRRRPLDYRKKPTLVFVS